MQGAHLAETEQTLMSIRPQHQQRQRQNLQFEGGENFDNREIARLQVRQNQDRKTGWRYYREPWGNPPAASSSSTSQWPTSQWQTSWSSWQPTSSVSVSWKKLQNIDGRCRQYTHKHCTYSAVQCLHKRGTHRTRLAQELHFHLCAPEKNLSSGLRMSHPPFTTSSSSSSFTPPSTTTPEHAQQSGQHDLLQEHPVHHEHLQALPVDKQRHQEPLWRENLQSGGNPRTTFST